MRRIATIVVPCFLLAGCAAPLGMVAAGLVGGAAKEASTHLGREASARMNLWLWGEDPSLIALDDAGCVDDPDADGCEPEALLAAYLRKASPERRERFLAALPPDLRQQMMATTPDAAMPAPAYGYAAPPPYPPRGGGALPTLLFSPFGAAAP